MGNAAGFLGTGECSSKIGGHKFKGRSVYIVVDFLQEHLLLGQRCREGGQLTLTRVGL